MAGQSEMRLRQSMRKRALWPALQDHHMLIQGLNLGRDGRAFRAESFDGTADHRLAPKSDARLPLEAHLMISNFHLFVDEFALVADLFIVHWERPRHRHKDIWRFCSA